MSSLDSKSPILTIGIPTYNRSEAVCDRLRELISFDVKTEIEVLIIDNHSTDNTISKLEEIKNAHLNTMNVRLISNASNIGYVGNFFKLFENCESEYLLICSDEDELIESGVQEILPYLSAHSPDFVSPIAYVNDSLYRGRLQKSEIEFAQHEDASLYVSGLIFKLQPARKLLPWLQSLVQDNALVEVYPQTALAGFLIASGGGRWHDSIVTWQRDNLPSSIAHSSGNEYHFLNGRHEQFKGALMLVDLLVSKGDLLPAQIKQVNEYKSILSKDYFRRVRQAIEEEDKDLLKKFDASARRYYFFFWLRKVYGSKIGSKTGRFFPKSVKKILLHFAP
jgi:glycosyltransferase involved in cell wall biosynthesis